MEATIERPCSPRTGSPCVSMAGKLSPVPGKAPRVRRARAGSISMIPERAGRSPLPSEKRIHRTPRGCTAALEGVGSKTDRQGVREGHESTFGPLPATDNDLSIPEVEVLNAQPQAFSDTKPHPIHQTCHQPVPPVHTGQDGSDLLAAEHNRDPRRLPGLHDVVYPVNHKLEEQLVEKQVRAHGK